MADELIDRIKSELRDHLQTINMPVAELQRRMGITNRETVDRVLRKGHNTSFARLKAACKVVGIELEVSMTVTSTKEPLI